MSKVLMLSFGDNFTAALLVIAGQYGNGEDRKKKLKADGYDYAKVQSLVNKLLPLTKE